MPTTQEVLDALKKDFKDRIEQRPVSDTDPSLGDTYFGYAQACKTLQETIDLEP